jgi:hypothetical protein
MKSTADIFLVKTHRMERNVIKHTRLDIAFSGRSVIALKVGF